MLDKTLLWISCGGCSGETQALLGVEGQVTDLVDLIDVDGLRLLWHPSLAEQDLGPIYRAVVAGREPLTVLCVEGSIALAEDGMFDIAGDAAAIEALESRVPADSAKYALWQSARQRGIQPPAAIASKVLGTIAEHAPGHDFTSVERQ